MLIRLYECMQSHDKPSAKYYFYFSRHSTPASRLLLLLLLLLFPETFVYILKHTHRHIPACMCKHLRFKIHSIVVCLHYYLTLLVLSFSLCFSMCSSIDKFSTLVLCSVLLYCYILNLIFSQSFYHKSVERQSPDV